MNARHGGAARVESRRALFPWRDAMSFGFGVLRLSPREFWAMTPRELSLAMTALRGGVLHAPDRAALDEMMTRFPDGAVPRFGGPGSAEP